MNIPQDPKESAQNFLLRAIELKEKHMRKFSNEDEGEEFLRSVEMRLYSNTDTFQIRPYPCTLTVTDEVLIDKISEAATGAGKTTKTEKPTWIGPQESVRCTKMCIPRRNIEPVTDSSQLIQGLKAELLGLKS